LNCSTTQSIGVNRPKYLRKPKPVYSLILIVLLLLISFFTGNARGAQTTLAWDTSTDTSVTGYKLYWGTQSQQYELLADVGNFTDETVSNLQGGTTYYFAATAYDARGNESGYSNEVSYTAPVDCAYSITPASGSFTAAGGTGSVNVTTQNGCSWTASSGASWITITSGGSGTGNGTVYYSVSANSGTASRTSASTIAGRLFTINQAGAETYTITASAGAGGTITPTGSTSVNAGGSQTYMISANSGYTISGVSVNGLSVGAVSSYAFNNVTSNQTIAATFAATTYTLSTSTSGTGAGTVTANPSGATFSAGTVVTLTATPNANSTFSGWSGACSGTSATCQVTMNSNLSAAASFAAKTVTYTITASAGTGGTISPSGSTSVNAGGSQTYMISANSGYTISGVSVNGSSVGAVSSYAFNNVTSNQTIVVTFAANTYTLSTSTSGTGAGTVTANPSGATFSAGTVVTLTATPNANSTFSGWSGACSGTSATCQVTMNSNLSAAASFAAKTVTYTITASAGAGGTISPSGSTSVNAGGSQTYTAAPNSGYRMFYFKVDGKYIFTSATSYTFANLKTNHKIAAYFRKK
jgi:hypothetical protein